MVMMVRRAGGVILGKTVTTELASLQPAGTRNPRNLAHTPGGSSSGSAAAVAAGMLPIAFGSQTGGSVIRPAAYCGVAGYKPSFRLMPTVGMKAFSWSLDTVGRVRRRRRGRGLCRRRHHRPGSARRWRDARRRRRLRSTRTHLWPEATPDMQAAVERAARAAEAAGSKIIELVLPPIFEETVRCHGIIQDYEAFRALAYEYDRHRDRLGPILREQLDKAAAITPDQYDEARRTTRRARQMLAGLMSDLDVILTPSAPECRPARAWARPASRPSTGSGPCSGTPCVNVPGMVDGSGLPLGVQIVGRFARDKVALAAARFVETALARAPAKLMSFHVFLRINARQIMSKIQDVSTSPMQTKSGDFVLL